MKKPRIEILFGPFCIFLLLLFLPLIFEFDYLIPIKRALSDFDITDIGIQLGRKNEKLEADTNIVIINVDKLNNKKLYYLLDELSKYNPKVVGIKELVKNDQYTEYRDSILFALTKLKNVVFASELNNFEPNFDSYIHVDRAYGPFLQLASSGFTNIIFGKDRKTNTARKFRPQANVAGETEMSFTYMVAEKYNPGSAAFLLQRDNKEEIIDYFGNKNNFFRLNDIDVLTSNFVPSLIENKIVLLGRLNPDDKLKYLDDMYFTPLCEMDQGKPYPDMYDVVLQANTIKMVIDYRYYNSVPQIFIIALSFIIVYLNFLIFYFISDKIPLWYEILSNLLFLMQSLLILVVIILLYNKLRLQADLTISLLGLAITIIFFEAYRDNIVPLTKKLIYILKHRRI